MVVPSPVPMCRYRNEPELQVGHRHGEAGVVEDPCYLVEFVKPWKAKLPTAYSACHDDIIGLPP